MLKPTNNEVYTLFVKGKDENLNPYWIKSAIIKGNSSYSALLVALKQTNLISELENLVSATEKESEYKVMKMKRAKYYKRVPRRM